LMVLCTSALVMWLIRFITGGAGWVGFWIGAVFVEGKVELWTSGSV
jgi:hypothetical protein